MVEYSLQLIAFERTLSFIGQIMINVGYVLDYFVKLGHALRMHVLHAPASLSSAVVMVSASSASTSIS